MSPPDLGLGVSSGREALEHGHVSGGHGGVDRHQAEVVAEDWKDAGSVCLLQPQFRGRTSGLEPN